MTEPQDPHRGQPPQSGQPSYGSQPPQYGGPPQHGEQPQYGGQPAYGAPPPSGAQPAYGGQSPQYGQQPYPQAPGYGYAAGPTSSGPRNGLGIAALILGILGLLTSWFVFGALLGVLAIILGFMGVRRVSRGEANNRGVSITGIVLGVLSIVIAVLFAVVIGTLFDRAQDCFDPELTQAEQQACVNERFDNTN